MSDSVRPHRRQPTRLPRSWDSPGKNTGVGCHFLLQCVKVKLLSHVRLLATPWTAAHQAPPSTGFSRQEYWSGVPLPSPQVNNKYMKSYSASFVISQSVSSVAQLCPTLCDPLDCSLPCSSIHGIFQARVLEWVTISLAIREIQIKTTGRYHYTPGQALSLSVCRR